MRAKLTRPDGTIVELEGTDDEVLKAILALSPPPPTPFILVQPLVAPVIAPAPVSPYPSWPYDIIVGSPTYTTCVDSL
jgi:hypothetical protein